MRHCYVNNENKDLVSMDKVEGAPAVSKTPLWVAGISCVFALGSGFCLFLMITGDLRDSYRRRHRSALTVSENTEGERKRGILSSSQTKHVVLTYHSVVNSGGKELQDWSCSICLEDDEPGADIRTVVLPCTHRFHRP